MLYHLSIFQLMLSAIALAFGSFGWGIRRGASTCMALCVPAIIPTLIDARGSWKAGLKVGLYYNLPRMILLTLIGAAIGFGGYALGEGLGGFELGNTMKGASYLIIGCLMVAYGTFIYATSSEKIEDIEEGRDCASKSNHPLFSRFKFTAPTSRSGLILWGTIVSLACIGETVLAIETVFVGIFTSGIASSPLGGALIGGFAFFMFALGTATPTLVIAAFSSRLADREKRAKRLVQIEMTAGILMMVFGAMFLLGAMLFF